MKKVILATLLATASLFVGVSTSEAGNHCRPVYHHNTYHHKTYCPPAVYKIHTCEINRCKHKKVRYDHCGKAFYYYVTVVTYRDSYSDGSHRTWTRTFS